MPEFRRNPISGDWVLYAAERAARPNDFQAAADVAECPFCPGNERHTPPEIVAGRPAGSPPDSPGWRWRVVPNKYPALSAETPGLTAHDCSDDWRAGTGRHEALIETPCHDAGLADLRQEEIREALHACRDRTAVLSREAGVRYVLVFKNCGQGSGASLRHPHTQIAALPFVPARVQTQLERARSQFERNGVCNSCDLVRREIADGSRLIHAGGEVAVVAPNAGRFAGEAWILPRRHEARFEQSSDDLVAHLSVVLRNVMAAFHGWAGEAPYNLVTHTAPSGADCSDFFHWRIELIPRLSGVAGFEWATGIHVNQVMPEEADRRYREHWGGMADAR